MAPKTKTGDKGKGKGKEASDDKGGKQKGAQVRTGPQVKHIYTAHSGNGSL